MMIPFPISTKPFSSPDVPPTVDQIYHSFGDTHPGGKPVMLTTCWTFQMYGVCKSEITLKKMLIFRTQNTYALLYVSFMWKLEYGELVIIMI